MTFAKLLARTSLIGVCIFLTACATIVPHTVQPDGPSFSAGVRNSSIVKFVSDGAIIDAHGRDRYNALIVAYGPFFAPALKADDGLIALSDGTYHIDDEHLSKALQMNLWRRSGQAPYQKSLLDKVIDAVK